MGYNRGEMAKVKLLRYEDGSQAFQWAETGDPHTFDPSDEDSVAVAFTKAVNDGIESGDEIEGEAAIQVAAVLKAAGQVVWPAGTGFDFIRDAVQDALPNPPAQGNGMAEPCPWWVKDIALDASKALICGYVDNEEEHYVVPFTLHGNGPDTQVVLGDRSTWVEVEREFVAKAGRMFSGRNLSALQAAHEELGRLITLGMPRVEEVEEAEEQEEATFKGVELNYTVEKADSAMRYTLGPLYAPMREDAHGEWVEDDTLHKALHEYVRDSSEDGRRINLQHGDKGDVTVGEWVECVRWPYEHTITVKNAGGESHEVEMPAGTVYLGVVWDEEHWDKEQNRPKGIDGYSLGGRAMKMRGTSESLKSMGYKVRKAS